MWWIDLYRHEEENNPSTVQMSVYVYMMVFDRFTFLQDPNLLKLFRLVR